MTTTQTAHRNTVQHCLLAVSFGLLVAGVSTPLAFAAPVHEPLEITPCRLQLVSTDPTLRVF